LTDFLLDTTVHIHWSRNEAAVVAWLHDAYANGSGLLTSVISVSEVYTRAHPHERSTWESYFRSLQAIPIDSVLAKSAGEMRYRLGRAGRQLHLADSLIAASALARNATIVTANAKDLELTGARVFQLDASSP
jgi:predicted nucleic acid-binding protein